MKGCIIYIDTANFVSITLAIDSKGYYSYYKPINFSTPWVQ